MSKLQNNQFSDDISAHPKITGKSLQPRLFHSPSLFKYIMLPQSASNRSSKINVRTRNNQFIFALAMIALQIVITVLYGIYCSTPPQLLNVGSALTVVFLAFLIVVGKSGLMKVLVFSLAPLKI
jgi:uncharacterized membrane protein